MRTSSPVWYQAMPTAGSTGTLKYRFTTDQSKCAVGKVWAKTGTLSSQKAYVGVAERPHDPEHPRVVFSLMMGNMDEQPAISAVGAFGQFAEALTHRGQQLLARVGDAQL